MPGRVFSLPPSALQAGSLLQLQLLLFKSSLEPQDLFFKLCMKDVVLVSVMQLKN